MPSIFEDTNPRALKELLQQIHSGTTALPDFQRDFVWDPNATQELVISIALNYPAGSLLRIINTGNLFAYREFQGAPEFNGTKPHYLVLDGQQRLTSLYQAFYGVGDHRYYLDLRKLMNGADFEDSIFHLRTTAHMVKDYADVAVQAKDLILPLSVLKGGAGDFFHWLFAIQPSLNENGMLNDGLMQSLSLIHANYIQIIDDYHFPVVTLSQTTGPVAVCTIFETLNRTGVKLRV